MLQRGPNHPDVRVEDRINSCRWPNAMKLQSRTSGNIIEVKATGPGGSSQENAVSEGGEIYEKNKVFLMKTGKT